MIGRLVGKVVEDSADGTAIVDVRGVNYPAGPFEWLAHWSVDGVVGVLRALDAEYRGERYRVSPWLRRHAHLQA